ncbi:hypothetical protein [Variovorax paradoxus]|uniref:hypothetical protein n=1 Tax=Variovorax paradoxus TaxID=34073 RepID=UPI003ECCC09F
MSTTVDIDFSRILPLNAARPRVAVADIVELSDEGAEERQVKTGIAVNLKRGPVKERVPPGQYLVRLRVPTGQVLQKRVRVRDEGGDTALEFVPERTAARGVEHYEDGGERLVVEDQLGGRIPSSVDLSSGSADRERWTARLIEPGLVPAALNYLPGLPVREVVNKRQDFMGVARLKTRSRSSAFRQQEGLSSYLVGDIDAVQATRLYGKPKELHAHWKYPLRNQSIIGRASDEGKGARYFALSYRATDDFYPLQVACMPGRWMTQDGTLASVSASYHLREFGQRKYRALRLEVDDPDFGGLIDFLQQGDLSGSVSVVNQSLETLYAKWRNPYAAAVAGYVLLNAGLPQREGWMNWRQWVLNLASRYTGLPDGAILYSTLLLQGPARVSEGLQFMGPDYEPFRSPLDATLEAVRRGPPLFRYGLKLLATNLEILTAEASATRITDNRRELQSAQRYIRELLLRVDPDQPFCVFDVAR